jgi:hypothetical protein
MLSPAQLTAFKGSLTTNPIPGLGGGTQVNNHVPMTDEQMATLPGNNPNSTTTTTPSGGGSDIVGETGKFLNDVGEEAGNEETSTWEQTPGNIKNDITTGASRIALDANSNDITAPLKVAGDIGETGMNTAADALKAIFAPITAAIGGITKGASDVISDNPEVQKLATSPMMDFLADKGGKLTAWANANPRAAQDLTNAATLAMGTAGEATGAPEENINLSDLKDMANKVVDTVKNAAATGEENLTKTTTPEMAQGTTDSQKVAQDAIKNPLTTKEQAQAATQGRATVTGSGLNKTIEYAPDPKTVAMQEALKPLADQGKITNETDINGKITKEAQVSNIANTQEEITNQGTKIRQALKDSNAIWNANELKGNLDSVKIPDPVKNEPAMNRNAISLKNAAWTIAQAAQKTPDGILDLRQNFDQYIKDNYGKNFFDKGRNADPWHQYVYSLRDSMNNMASYKLPEGNLPDGTPYGTALKNQSSLINAKEEMGIKLAQEHPEGVKITAEFLKAHPLLRRVGWRIGMEVVGGALGLYSLGKLLTQH